MSIFLGLPKVRQEAQAQEGRLLCILHLRFSSVPSDPTQLGLLCLKRSKPNPTDRFRVQPRTYRLLNEPGVEPVRGYASLCVLDSGVRVSDLRRRASVERRFNVPGGSAEASRVAIRPMPLWLAGLRGHVARFRWSECSW